MGKMTNYIAPGKHLLIDLWDVASIDEIDEIKNILSEAAEICGAKVLEIILHKFGEQCGITGVAILAESHISIHTWPEISYVAIDVFMCGSCDPTQSISVFKKYFNPGKLDVSEHQRGMRL